MQLNRVLPCGWGGEPEVVCKDVTLPNISNHRNNEYHLLFLPTTANHASITRRHDTTIMHYLHPRSRTTGTLFTGTLAVSFLVVALPHLLPCPVDRRQFTETIEMPDGTTKRRRRKVKESAITESDVPLGAENAALTMAEEARPMRECPVPKPGALVDKVMAFEQRGRERATEVVMQMPRARKTGGVGDSQNAP